MSSCSLKDVYGPDVVSTWGDNIDEGALNEARKKLHGDRIYFSAVTGKTEYGKVPTQVGQTSLGSNLGERLAPGVCLRQNDICGQLPMSQGFCNKSAVHTDLCCVYTAAAAVHRLLCMLGPY